MVIAFVSDEMFVAIADAQLEFKKKSDGTPVFDLNRLFAYSKKTLLDSAIEISGKSSMISQAIRQAGGFTCQELRDQQERYVRGQLRGVLLTTIATVMIPEIVSNRKERVTPCSAVVAAGSLAALALPEKAGELANYASGCNPSCLTPQ